MSGVSGQADGRQAGYQSSERSVYHMIYACRLLRAYLPFRMTKKPPEIAKQHTL